MTSVVLLAVLLCLTSGLGIAESVSKIQYKIQCPLCIQFFYLIHYTQQGTSTSAVHFLHLSGGEIHFFSSIRRHKETCVSQTCVSQTCQLLDVDYSVC